VCCVCSCMWLLPGPCGAVLLLSLCCKQILCMHGGLSPELKSLEQIKRVARPTDVPDSGLLCDLLWADPDKDIQVCQGNGGTGEGEKPACL